MAAGNEVSSQALAALAGRVLAGHEPTRSEVRKLAASVLSQAADAAERQVARPRSVRKVVRKAAAKRVR